MQIINLKIKKNLTKYEFQKYKKQIKSKCIIIQKKLKYKIKKLNN